MAGALDYDFQQITGRSQQRLIYFKIRSEELVRGKSYKQLLGTDLDGAFYTGVGVRDCEQVLRAINVRRIGAGIMSEDLSQYILTEDGQIVVQEDPIYSLATAASTHGTIVSEDLRQNLESEDSQTITQE